MINFKTISLIIYFIFLFVNSQKIYSVSTVSGVSGMDIRAGYGYLGRSSEVEANSEIELDICEKSSKKKCEYLNKNAFGHLGYLNEAKNYSEKYFREVSILEKVREQLFEYLSLQMAALDKSFVGKIPKCLKGNKKVKKMHDDISKFTKKSQPSTLSNISKITPKDSYYGNNNQLSKLNTSFNYFNNDFKNKIIAIEGSLLPYRIAEATLTYEYINRAFHKRCWFPNNVFNKLSCVDIKSKLDRIKSSFPILTTGNLLPSIASIIGSDFVSADVKTKVIERGNKIIDQYLPPQNNFSFDNLLGNTSAIYNKAIINTLKGKTKEHKENRNSFFNMTKLMKEKLKIKFQNDLNKICQTSFKNILKDYPVVIRQMYLDRQDKNEKNDLRKYLCENGFMKNFKNTVTNSCIGVSGNINGPNGLIVKKAIYDFPYLTRVFYRIKKDKNSGFIIELPRRYNFIYDPTIDPTHQDFDKRTSVLIQGDLIQQERKFIEVTKSWNKKTEEFFNNASKDHIPPVNLKIVDSQKVKAINVSACFTTDVEPKGYRPSRIAWSGDVLKSAVTPGKYRCGSINSFQLFNWEDTSNYTLRMNGSDLFHENGHHLSLDDTYNAYYLPTSLVGELDDLMASAKISSQIYPRDIKRIIFPALNCVD